MCAHRECYFCAGSHGGYDAARAAVDPSLAVGSICANVYVFDPDQQLISCCAYPLTPNHLKTLSVRQDLVSNTLTPGTPSSVSMVVLATTDSGVPSTCNPAKPIGDPSGAINGGLATGLRAWSTTLHEVPGGNYRNTEFPLIRSTASASEIDKLVRYCGFILTNGSGFGICRSCRQGGQGADRR